MSRGLIENFRPRETFASPTNTRTPRQTRLFQHGAADQESVDWAHRNYFKRCTKASGGVKLREMHMEAHSMTGNSVATPNLGR